MDSSIHLEFHVSQLKQALSSVTLIEPSPSCFIDDFEWEAILEQVYAYCFSKESREWEVLIQWKGLPEHEATWGSISFIREQFLDFPLKDKEAFNLGGIVRPPIYILNVMRGRNGNSPV